MSASHGSMLVYLVDENEARRERVEEKLLKTMPEGIKIAKYSDVSAAYTDLHDPKNEDPVTIIAGDAERRGKSSMPATHAVGIFELKSQAIVRKNKLSEQGTEIDKIPVFAYVEKTTNEDEIQRIGVQVFKAKTKSGIDNAVDKMVEKIKENLFPIASKVEKSNQTETGLGS